jgi:thioredoxin reductase (NADPH)
VTLLVRRDSVAATMSRYLIDEIEGTESIDVRHHAEIVGAGGDGRLENLVLRDNRTGETETVAASALFVMVGADPHTEWLPETIQRDGHGFVKTGADVEGWSLPRPPFAFETSLPGVFAAGDVRHGSVKRVASAVGEGSIVTAQVCRFLADPEAEG